jgi:hypothetical protein
LIYFNISKNNTQQLSFMIYMMGIRPNIVINVAVAI